MTPADLVEVKGELTELDAQIERLATKQNKLGYRILPEDVRRITRMVQRRRFRKKQRASANIHDACTLSDHSHQSGACSAKEKMSMWNSKKYLTIAVLGVGLGVTAAVPASACGWGGGYGAAGYGGYGAVGYGGYGGCGGYGAAGYGGYGGCGGYGAAGYGGYGGCGGYGAAGYGGYGGCGGYGGGYGYAPTYGGYGGCGGYGAVGYGGYGGWGGGYGAVGYGDYGGGYGWGCHSRHHRAGHGSYAVAYLPRHTDNVYAAYAPRSRHWAIYAPAHGARYSANQ